MSDTSLLTREAAEAPDRVARMLAENAGLARNLATGRPQIVVTCARGSSDHAAAGLRFAAQAWLGVPAFDVQPGLASVYDMPLDLSGALFIAVSQSGQSPDLLSAADWARRNGARTLALVNAPDAPLAAACDAALPVGAGEERSVAATKSFLCSAAAGLQLLAELAGTDAARRTVAALPDLLAKAAALDWQVMIPPLAEAETAYVIGRGPGLGVAQEMALKFKECCVLHAEAVSAAEIMHGPFQMLSAGLPVLALGQRDASEISLRNTLGRIAGQGTPSLVALDGYAGAGALPVVSEADSLTAPLAALQSFYGAIGALAAARGHDPDRPALLRKVTETT